MKDKQKGRKVVFMVVFLGLLVVSAVVVILFSNRFFFGTRGELNVGILYDPGNSVQAKYVAAAEMALRDIETASTKHPSVGKLSELKLWLRWENETMEEALHRMHHSGVRLFLLEQIIANFSTWAANCTNCTFITDTAVSKQDGLDSVVLTVGPSMQLTVNAYLTLLRNTTQGNQGSVKVLPVMRDTPDLAVLFQHFVNAVKAFPDISLLNPVVYTPSQYPKSDAFEIISNMGSRIALQPDAQILMLSTEEIPDILSLTHINQELNRRRWYAVNAVHLAEDIRASARGRNAGGLVSFTTLSYLGDGQPDSIRNHFLRRRMQTRTAEGTIYLECNLYLTIVKIHRALAETSLDTSKEFDDELQRQLEISDAVTGDTSEGSMGGIFLSMFLMPDTKDVVMVPEIGWLVEAVLNATYTSTGKMSVDYSAVKTSPLSRKELESVYESKKRVCPNPIFDISIHPRVFMPKFKMSLSLDELPAVLILPVEGGIELTVHCNNQSSGFMCTHSKLDEGELVCRVDTRSAALINTRRRRGTEEEGSGRADDSDGEDDVSKSLLSLSSSSRTKLQETGAEFKAMVEEWTKLTPRVVGCFSSLAGCDYCFYFLTTYNISVAPAACSAGCTLGIFGSCSALLTKSVFQTFELE